MEEMFDSFTGVEQYTGPFITRYAEVKACSTYKFVRVLMFITIMTVELLLKLIRETFRIACH